MHEKNNKNGRRTDQNRHGIQEKPANKKKNAHQASFAVQCDVFCVYLWNLFHPFRIATDICHFVLLLCCAQFVAKLIQIRLLESLFYIVQWVFGVSPFVVCSAFAGMCILANARAHCNPTNLIRQHAHCIVSRAPYQTVEKKSEF